MKTAWIFALVVVSALAATSCGNDRFIVIGTATAPSTSGFVELDDTRSNGATILVHMEQLHPVEQIDPKAKFYVVWLDGGVGAPVRAGVLRYDPDHRTGELRTDVPFTKFTVKITAEATATPSAPGEVEVASQGVNAES